MAFRPSGKNGREVWVKVGDEAPESVKFSVAQSPMLFSALFGQWNLLLHAASRARSNGFLTRAVVQRWTTPRVLAMLAMSVHGKAPLLHRRGDKCRCLDVHRGRWPEHADFLLHDYLDHQPDAVEAAVKQRQQAERDDKALRRAVRARDADTCRYCLNLCNDKDTRGARGLQLDHVNPALACGASNLVVACRDCNSRKGRRLPEEAGLRLRTVEEARAAAGPRADHGGPNADHGAAKYRATDGTGRDGEAGALATIGPPSIDRPSDHPNPYHRSGLRSLPEHHAGVAEPEHESAW